MVYTFLKDGSAPVYTDFVAIKENFEEEIYILALSLIGPEITVKSYRAIFINSGSCITQTSYLVNPENMELQCSRPLSGYKTLPIKRVSKAIRCL